MQVAISNQSFPLKKETHTTPRMYFQPCLVELLSPAQPPYAFARELRPNFAHALDAGYGRLCIVGGCFRFT